jgi:hypothetical protein
MGDYIKHIGSDKDGNDIYEIYVDLDKNINNEIQLFVKQIITSTQNHFSKNIDHLDKNSKIDEYLKRYKFYYNKMKKYSLQTENNNNNIKYNIIANMMNIQRKFIKKEGFEKEIDIILTNSNIDTFFEVLRKNNKTKFQYEDEVTKLEELKENIVPHISGELIGELHRYKLFWMNDEKILLLQMLIKMSFVINKNSLIETKIVDNFFNYLLETFPEKFREDFLEHYIKIYNEYDNIEQKKLSKSQKKRMKLKQKKILSLS